MTKSINRKIRKFNINRFWNQKIKKINHNLKILEEQTRWFLEVLYFKKKFLFHIQKIIKWIKRHQPQQFNEKILEF